MTIEGENISVTSTLIGLSTSPLITGIRAHVSELPLHLRDVRRHRAERVLRHGAREWLLPNLEARPARLGRNVCRRVLDESDPTRRALPVNGHGDRRLFAVEAGAEDAADDHE